MNNGSSDISKKFFALLSCGLGALVCLRAIFIFLPAPQCWGINIFSFVPIEWGVALTAIALGAIGWGLVGNKNQLTPRTSSINIFSRNAIIIIPLVCGAIFYFCSIPVALLGDGGLYEGDIFRHIFFDKPLPLYHEPLTMFLNSGIDSLLYSFGVKNLVEAYRVSGTLFGMLYVATALKIASNVRAPYSLRVLAFVLLISCGGTLLFFGYIENYAPQYALDLLYIALVFHTFRANGSPLLPAAVLMLACLFHFQNILLIPSFVVALGARKAMRSGTSEKFAKRVFMYAAIAAPALLAAYAYFQWRPVAPLDTGDNPFIPYFKIGRMSYTLFSPMHLVDLVNEHLLLAPVAIVVMIAMIVGARKKIRWTSPEMVTVLIATLGLEAFLIGGNLQLGVSRDWDVVAFLGPMITLIAILALENISAIVVMRNRFVIAIGGVAMAGTIGWIAVNINADTEIARFQTLLEYHRSAVTPMVTRYGYENIRKVYYERKDVQNELGTDSIMLGIIPWHFDLMRAMTFAEHNGGAPNMHAAATLDHIVWNIVRTASDTMMRLESAGDEGGVRIAPPHAGNPSTLGDLIMLNAINQNNFYKRWSMNDVLAFADTLNARYPSLPYGTQLKGWIFFIHGELDTASLFLRRAIAIDTSRAMPVAQLASYFNSVGQRDSLKTYALRALRLDAGYADAIKLLEMSLRGNAITAADTVVVRAILNGSRICLAQASERHLEKKDISSMSQIEAQAESVLRQLNQTE